MRLVVENLELPTLVEPDDPAQNATQTQEKLWEKACEDHAKRVEMLKENVKTLYSLIWGQCTDIIKQNLESLDTFKTISATGNGLSLLLAVRDILFNFQSQKYIVQAVHKAQRRLY